MFRGAPRPSMIGIGARTRSDGISSPPPLAQGTPSLPAVWTLVNDANLIALFALATVVKLLLVPAYHSTDFEVHRNWMAITASLPFTQWYYELARLFDPGMLTIQEQPYFSAATLVFMRMSVIASDAVLFLGVRSCCIHVAGPQGRPVSMAATILLSAGLFIVDHIHFQYNGFLLGILLLSIAHVFRGNLVMSAFYFAVLLNLKHIFLYMAPTYFVFLLRSYCFADPAQGGYFPQFLPRNFFRLGGAVGAVFAVSFGPFAATGSLGQILQRLFPFKRGLMHAYWAANFWAIYGFLDRILIFVVKYMGISVPVVEDALGSVTRGIVGDVKFAVLPNITPQLTFILSILAMLPSLVSIWRKPSNLNFVLQLVNCSLSSFVFGWHVHEKAILNVLVPLSLLTVNCAELVGQEYVLLTIVGEFALFPLLYGIEELPLKAMLWVVHIFLCSGHLYDVGRIEISWVNILYSLGLGPLLIFYELSSILPNFSAYPFLPLMLISAYSALGVCSVWLRLQRMTIQWMVARHPTAPDSTIADHDVDAPKKSQ